jgi:hypothetical protein
MEITNLTGLEKPATALIERISDAIGGLAKPWQIGRIADAEARAEIIRARARIEVSEIEERAIQRLVIEEGVKQKNIENITARALPLLEHSAQPEAMEQDWIAHFFDRGRMISNSEMQSLWAGLLAREANSPGVISKRTIDLVASLDRSDAELFTKLCTFSWTFGLPTLFMPRVGYPHPEIEGLKLSDLLHLSTLGLITMERPMSGGYTRQSIPNESQLDYFGARVVFSLSVGINSMYWGMVMFTKYGEQLASICNGQPSIEYFLESLRFFADRGAYVWTKLDANYTPPAWLAR